MYGVVLQTLLRHSECSSARTNRDVVVDEMKRALDRIQLVITDSGSLPGNDHQQQQQQHSPTSLSVNAADSGISLSQLQTTAFRAIKDFEVLFLSTVHLDIDVNTHTHTPV